MNKKVKIGYLEFSILLIMTIVANDKTSGIFGYELKQDKLFALIGALILSCGVFTMYYFIFKNTGFQDLSKTFELLLGKLLTKGLLFFYGIYFLWIATIDSRDIMQFVYTFLLDTAPPLLLRAMFLLTIYLSLISGLEVLSRTAIMLFNFVLIIFLTFSPLVLFLNEINLDHFFPIFEFGVKPLILPTLIMSVSVPFGEYFAVMFIFPKLKEFKKSLKYGIFSILFSGFIIITVFILNLLVFSPETFTYMLSPALRISRRVDMEDFFQRFDFITLVILLFLSYVKVFILIYVAKYNFESITKFKKEKILYGFLCFIVLITMNYYYPDYVVLLKTTKTFIIPYINPTFEFVIPFLLFGLSFIKKKKIKQQLEASQNQTELPKGYKGKVSQLFNKSKSLS